MADKSPFCKYRDSQTSEKITEEELMDLYDYIEELEQQLEEADELIQQYAEECGDNDFDDDDETQMEDEEILSLGEAFTRKVRFNRAKRRQRRKYYRRNRAKIKQRQKKYKRSASFRRAKRLRSRTAYKHKKYI